MPEQKERESDVAIHSVDGIVNWQEESDRRGADIRKIVIGSLKGDDREASVPRDRLPLNLTALFPGLTHLYLWGIEGLEELPTLPGGLLCLDVRTCPALTRLGSADASLPRGLEQFVVQGCPELVVQPRQVDSLTKLTDLVVRDSLVGDSAMDALLRGSKQLALMDLSGSSQLTRINSIPPTVVDIRLDRCERLSILPEAWPPNLRRLGLRGAKLVRSLPDFKPKLDYVDLAFTESLKALPSERGRPRTLFLYGSGVLVPPASEHGRSPDENVAARTKAYYRDVELVGKGDVRRCKVLLLGNGDAGKTTLGLALDPNEDPAGAKKLGSTHGVRFQDLSHDIEIDGLLRSVHVHLWDFGGQEIYHNTHRLFMEKGAIFVLVWDPQQIGKQPERSLSGYQDVWRPLQYWVDFIRLSSRNPRILVVCNRKPGLSRSDDAIRSLFKRELRAEDRESIQLVISDVEKRAGEFQRIGEWIQAEVQSILSTQGTAVPSYWEIAQQMVEAWTRRSQGKAPGAEHDRQMTFDHFGERLWQAIGEAVQQDDEGRYWKLLEAVDRGDFRLADDDRVRRTLEFLTNSGWLYWDPKLFEERVIVGQDWALAGIYAALDRTHESVIYDRLARAGGRFTRSTLAELCWGQACQQQYSEAEQKLLCSFMVSCGLAFVLRSERESWREENVYVAFEYLRDVGAAALEPIFNRRTRGLPNKREVIRNDRLHRLHWQALLIEAGAEFGANADYASDGVYVETVGGTHYLFRLHLDPESGLGGRVEVRVAGANADQALSNAVARVNRHLPAAETGMERASSPAREVARPRLSVFLSYAWNRKEGDAGQAPEVAYESPVDAIEKMLAGLEVHVVRDRRVSSQGDDIHDFMVSAAKSDRIIIVHSDKYCESPDCMFELKHVVDRLAEEERRSFQTTVIPVEHPTSRVSDTTMLNKYIAYWRAYVGVVPGRLGWELEELKDYAIASLRDFSGRVSRLNSTNIKWRGDGSAALREVQGRIERALHEWSANVKERMAE